MASSDSGERKRGRNSEWRKHWPKGAGWIWNHDEQTLISKCRSRSVDIIGPGTNEIVGMSFVLSRKRFALLLLLLFPARNGVVIREDRSSVLTKAWWLPACASSSPSPLRLFPSDEKNSERLWSIARISDLSQSVSRREGGRDLLFVIDIWKSNGEIWGRNETRLLLYCSNMEYEGSFEGNWYWYLIFVRILGEIFNLKKDI